jgi:hypothetical protein
VRWIAAVGRVEYASSGEASRMHGVCRDITERLHAQLEAQRLQNEIAHVGRVSMMGQLASALAHELNQPLGAILRNAEAAELFMQTEKPDLEEIRAILADIRTDDQRASGVIDRMRTLLKRNDLDARTLDVAELVGNVVGLARPDATRRVTRREVPADLPPVRGDRCISSRCCSISSQRHGCGERGQPGASPRHRERTVDGAQTSDRGDDTGHHRSSRTSSIRFSPPSQTAWAWVRSRARSSGAVDGSGRKQQWRRRTFRFTLPVGEEARGEGRGAREGAKR